MESEVRTKPPTVARGRARRCVALLGAAWLAGLAQAQTGGAIYTCTTPDGQRLTSDRPIPACRSVEQRVLNRDGSLRQVLPPTLTAEELVVKEAEERRQAAIRQAQQDAVRRDRNLKQRYPDEAAHLRARESALDTVRLALRSGEQRLQELQREREPLIAETEFYAGRELPAALRQRLDANEASQQAQRNAISAHRAEIDRINGVYDVELERLRKLWAGAQPGSLGPMPSGTLPVAAGAATAAPR